MTPDITVFLYQPPSASYWSRLISLLILNALQGKSAHNNVFTQTKTSNINRYRIVLIKISTEDVETSEKKANKPNSV